MRVYGWIFMYKVSKMFNLGLNHTVKSVIAWHFWNTGHKINYSANLLKSVNKMYELIIWEKIFIKIQNKWKESENSYWKLKVDRHTETKSKYFDRHSSPSQSEESEYMSRYIYNINFPPPLRITSSSDTFIIPWYLQNYINNILLFTDVLYVKHQPML